MKLQLRVIIPLLCLALTLVTRSMAQHTANEALEQTIMRLDSTFWAAYNRCDVKTMSSFFTDDVEFYHDKGGPTFTRAKLDETVQKGLCGNANWRLRREAVAGTVQIFPMNNYGAIISGQHVFYINEAGKPEFLDGLARFTHLWRFQNNEWKMHRVLSYDHGPASRLKTTTK